MANTEKRDAARRKLLRLLEGLEFYRAWRISGIKKLKGEVWQADLDKIVEPSTNFIDYFDNAGSQYCSILLSVQQWYSHTYAELSCLMAYGDEKLSFEARRFLKDFRSEIGFDFQSEAEIGEKTAQKALKNGKIASERDYYILEEVENTVDQTLLTEAELAAVSKMFRQFKAKQAALRRAKARTFRPKL